MNTTAGSAPTPELPDAVTLPAEIRSLSYAGADALEVRTSAATAVLLLDGAQLISWKPAGEDEALWLSPGAECGPGLSARGGIPLVGPWFGPGIDGKAPFKHGWLRTSRWSLVDSLVREETAVLSLRVDDPSGSGISALVCFQIGTELEVDLTLTAGTEELLAETALHTYLAVEDVREVRLHGLLGADYLDNTRGLAADRQEEELLCPEGTVDRVYSVNGPVVLEDPGLRRRIISTPRGTSRTVVWNPWESMSDVPGQAWDGFVCIEPAVCKEGAVRLAPGASHTIGVTYRIEH